MWSMYIALTFSHVFVFYQTTTANTEQGWAWCTSITPPDKYVLKIAPLWENDALSDGRHSLIQPLLGDCYNAAIIAGIASIFNCHRVTTSNIAALWQSSDWSNRRSLQWYLPIANSRSNESQQFSYCSPTFSSRTVASLMWARTNEQ